MRADKPPIDSSPAAAGGAEEPGAQTEAEGEVTAIEPRNTEQQQHEPELDREQQEELGSAAQSLYSSTTPTPSFHYHCTSLLDYFDRHEYDAAHVLYNNSCDSPSGAAEGRLLSDFDHTYDYETYPTRGGSGGEGGGDENGNNNNGGGAGGGTSSIATVSTKKAPPSPVRGAGGKSSQKNNNLTADADASNGANAAPAQPPLPPPVPLPGSAVPLSAHADYTFSNSKPWPSALQQFQIGDRVDAVDYKGTWYPGSVIDLFDISEKDIKTHNLTRYSRDFMRKDAAMAGVPNSNSSAGAAPPPASKEICTAGLHMRVHFDGFKGNWDEWFDQRDFERGE